MTDAINAPVKRSYSRREVHTSDLPAGQRASFELDGEVLTRPDEEIITEADPAITSNDYAAELAFMEEPVTIMLDRGREKYAPTVLDFYVNGRAEWVPVGREWTLKRKYVEVIARATPYDVQTEIQDEQGEKPRNMVHRYTSTKFPFSVIKDSPKGFAWLAKIRRES